MASVVRVEGGAEKPLSGAETVIFGPDKVISGGKRLFPRRI